VQLTTAVKEEEDLVEDKESLSQLLVPTVVPKILCLFSQEATSQFFVETVLEKTEGKQFVYHLF